MNEWFRDKNVLVTGHTGFKGSWLCLWLDRLGARVSGLALDPETSPSLFALADVRRRLEHDLRVDIRDRARVATAVSQTAPDVVLHLAAQPIVKTSYEQPIETFATNVMGTLHVLEAVRALGRPCVVVVVTTDKVYANAETGRAFTESDPLGGHDPYSASKACAEIAVASFRASFADRAGLRIATARAGNVIGGGDWSAHRLVPDIARSLSRGEAIRLRNPSSTRPWQHVLEPLAGYLDLAAALGRDTWSGAAKAFNFGPDAHGVRDVASVASLAVDAWNAHGLEPARVEIAREVGAVHEAGTLSLTIDESARVLGWAPRWDLETSVRRTIDWYADQHRGLDARALVQRDLEAFEAARTSA